MDAIRKIGQSAWKPPADQGTPVSDEGSNRSAATLAPSDQFSPTAQLTAELPDVTGDLHDVFSRVQARIDGGNDKNIAASDSELPEPSFSRLSGSYSPNGVHSTLAAGALALATSSAAQGANQAFYGQAV